ncbi:MAG TPA: glycosyltransferase family 2 protein [Candidatus Choladousia intestinavium]|uniref:Glycosyltransferase family 2 protein n=1 Tax=Candidatus Choladousia intestinavium TaxID=2840727 RepID=A0A9D1A9A9_9FIRM|nr:glycosyltransferase family 2 protein [Candidatus Choladousia intestinavium]
MSTISLCMIVKDEEETLGRCLDGMKDLVDEIILVDTGSSDGTKEIAALYTDQIYDCIWEDDFSRARNFALSKGKGEYLMWMDADDVLDRRYAKDFLEMKERLGAADVIMMPYVTQFDSRGEPAFVYERERIFRNHGGFWFQGRVHEAVTPSGIIQREKIPIEHRKIKQGDPDRNLRIYETMEKEGVKFSGRELYYYGRELLAHRQFCRGKEIFEAFLRREDGWEENKIDATRQMAYCCYGLGDEKGALEALLKGLAYDTPRGETCCDLGRHFMERGRYQQAVYWYQQALRAEKRQERGAFVQEECYDYLPAISLCICFDRMGDLKTAEKYNELAGIFQPDSPSYLYNKGYFRDKNAEEKES